MNVGAELSLSCAPEGRTLNRGRGVTIDGLRRFLPVFREGRH